MAISKIDSHHPIFSDIQELDSCPLESRYANILKILRSYQDVVSDYKEMRHLVSKMANREAKFAFCNHLATLLITSKSSQEEMNQFEKEVPICKGFTDDNKRIAYLLTPPDKYKILNEHITNVDWFNSIPDKQRCLNAVLSIDSARWDRLLPFIFSLIVCPQDATEQFIYYLTVFRDVDEKLFLEFLSKIPPGERTYVAKVLASKANKTLCVQAGQKFVNALMTNPRQKYPWMEGIDAWHFLPVLWECPPEKMENCAIHAPKLFKNKSIDVQIKLLQAFAKFPGESMEAAGTYLSPLIEKWKDFEPIEIIYLLDDRPNINIEMLVKHLTKPFCASASLPYILNIICYYDLIPEKEKEAFFNSLPDYRQMQKRAGNINPLLLYYLLPEELRKIEVDVSKNPDHQRALLLSCWNKLHQLANHPENTVVAIIKLINQFNLPPNHSLYMRAKLVQTMLQHKNNPYKIHDELTRRAQEPCTFMPKASEFEGMTIAIDMNKLRCMPGMVKRDLLPKNATVKAWNELCFELSEKVRSDPAKAFKMIGELLNPSDPNIGNTTWSLIEKTLFNDPTHLLTKLLESEEEYVSQTDANWRSVVSHILNKNDPEERFGSFLMIMSTIVHCPPGIIQGIDVVFNMLPPHERYKIHLSRPRSISEIMEEGKKEKTLKFLETFLVDKEDKVQALLDFAKNDTRKSSKKFSCLIPCNQEEYWDPAYALRKTGEPVFKGDEDFEINADQEIDNAFYFRLNPQGAKKIVKICSQEKVKGPVLDFVYQAVKLFIDRQFSGTNDLMKELIEAKPDQKYDPTHNREYLKNLIGHLLGARDACEEIFWDDYTAWISPQFIGRSRDAVLEIFFKHATPEAMVKALMWAVNEEIEKNNSSELFKAYLPDVIFWTGKNQGTLSPRGALELLLDTVLSA